MAKQEQAPQASNPIGWELGAVVLGCTIMFLFMVLWPYRMYVAALILGVAFVYVVLHTFMKWERHHLETKMYRQPKDETKSGWGKRVLGMLWAEIKRWVLGAGPTEQQAKPKPKVLFRTLLQRGIIKPDGPLVLAMENPGEKDEQVIKLDNPTSAGIGGLSGGGKTNTTKAVMLSTIVKYKGRVKFIVTDPHMLVDSEDTLVHAAQALAPYFLTVADIRATVPAEDHDYHLLLDKLEANGGLANPHADKEVIKNWMKVVDMELARRITGKTGDIWVMLMDEFAAIVRDQATGKAVADTLEEINRQARKMDMFAILISQEWKVNRMGSSALRDSIVTFLLHTMPTGVSSLIVPEDEAQKTPRLKVGQILFYSRDTSQIGYVPYILEGDAQIVLKRYPPTPRVVVTEEPVRQIAGPVIEATPLNDEVKGAETVKLPDLSEEEEESLDADVVPDFSSKELAGVQEAFVLGLTEVDIAKRVYGVKAGPELAEAKIMVRHILKYLVGRSV